LESIHLAVLNGASEGDDFEPLHLLHGLAGFGYGISRGIGKALRRLANDFNNFPNQTLSPPETAYTPSRPLFVFAHDRLVRATDAGAGRPRKSRYILGNQSIGAKGLPNLMVEYNKLKETLDIFVPRNNSDASITLTMTADKAKQLYESLQKVLKENELI